ncbi:MAG: hypothetical protein JJU36_13145 [Phycisphaeraceae bacterium]|nr:hypothetical protein [Phycisphaeraceae bacterium]
MSIDPPPKSPIGQDAAPDAAPTEHVPVSGTEDQAAPASGTAQDRPAGNRLFNPGRLALIGLASVTATVLAIAAVLAIDAIGRSGPADPPWIDPLSGDTTRFPDEDEVGDWSRPMDDPLRGVLPGILPLENNPLGIADPEGADGRIGHRREASPFVEEIVSWSVHGRTLEDLQGYYQEELSERGFEQVDGRDLSAHSRMLRFEPRDAADQPVPANRRLAEALHRTAVHIHLIENEGRVRIMMRLRYAMP